MLETGMRVGDAIRYDPKAANRGEALWVYPFVPQKTQRTAKQKIVKAYLSNTLKKSIDQCEWLSVGLPFYFGSAKNPSYLANEVYERMKTIGSRCGVTDAGPIDSAIRLQLQLLAGIRT